MDYTSSKNTKGECSSASAQSVWAVLAEVKTNTIVAVAGSQEKATTSLEEGCYLFFSTFFSVFFSLHLLRERCNTESKAKMLAVTVKGCRMFIPAQCPSAVQSVRTNMFNKHIMCLLLISSTAREEL